MLCYQRRRKGLEGLVKPGEAINSGNEGQGPVHQVADLPGENSMMESILTLTAPAAPSQVSSSQCKRLKLRVDPAKASNSGNKGRGPVHQIAYLPGKNSMMDSTPQTVRIVVVGLMAPSQDKSGPQPKQSKRRINPVKASNSACKQSQHPRQRKNRKRVAADLDDSEAEQTRASVSRAHRQSRRRVRNARQKGMLDDKLLNKYLGDLWQTIPREKKDSHDYIDCLWFEMYLEGDRKKPLGYIKRDRKFSKKYVFLPICLYNHWSLLIFCHVGEDLQSKAATPCILLLDSMRKNNPKQDIEKVLREFLLDIYEGEGRSVSKQQIDKIPLLVPKVPQQTGDKECGYYVLYYITQFLMSSPESFSVSDGYPDFMSQDWFTAEQVTSFRETLPAPDQETGSRNDSSDDASDDVVCL
ncbi:uncharacterized protein LOC108195712 [Daucus carota subsp. sativus]|uniref:uncharacterized protein LOC108195712 n=1 Tax=Daucus carota subsp. sativus TaxID=79200 RepID=UPI0007EFC64C|nr:PREDICTED: uncharacterized protein LOC108195712 [Daucus carota subsp. sativus]